MELYKQMMCEAHFPHWQVANINSDCCVSRTNHVTICARTMRADTRQIQFCLPNISILKFISPSSPPPLVSLHALASAACADICWRDYGCCRCSLKLFNIEFMSSRWTVNDLACLHTVSALVLFSFLKYLFYFGNLNEILNPECVCSLDFQFYILALMSFPVKSGDDDKCLPFADMKMGHRRMTRWIFWFEICMW